MADDTSTNISAALKDTSIKDPVLIALHTELTQIKESYNQKTFTIDVANPTMLAQALYMSRGIAGRMYDLQTSLIRYIAKVDLRYRLFKLEAMDSMSVEKSKEYPLTSDYENTKNLHYAKAILEMVEIQLVQMEGWNATFSRLQTALSDSTKHGLLDY
jgi:hypothetical protein